MPSARRRSIGRRCDSAVTASGFVTPLSHASHRFAGTLGGSMNRLGLVIPLLALVTPVRAQENRGAGSPAAAKLIQERAKAHQAAGGAPVAYDATGSGEGVRRVKAGQAVFAVSDVALSVPELQAGRLIQFPVALVGIVPIVNLPGGASAQLRLTAD